VYQTRENDVNKYAAEFIGTFWLVLGGCGSAVLAAAFPELGIGLAGVSLAFGLTVLTMAYAIGHISGCHLNPAVSVGLWAGGRFPAGQLLPYLIAQVAGAIVAGGVLYLIASGKAGFDVTAGFASNGYAAHSPGGYSLQAALISEVVMTALFLVVILGATDARAPQGFAPIAIGLCLTLIHLISIPVTNTSVNPARSTGVALYVGDWAVAQLWAFWVAPVAGALLGAGLYRLVGGKRA
jgi:aquaporin Z